MIYILAQAAEAAQTTDTTWAMVAMTALGILGPALVAVLRAWAKAIGQRDTLAEAIEAANGEGDGVRAKLREKLPEGSKAREELRDVRDKATKRLQAGEGAA